MMTLTPAYGRDYKSKEEVLADFDANKDFLINGGPESGRYVNKEELGGEEVKFRYARQKRVFVHVVPT